MGCCMASNQQILSPGDLPTSSTNKAKSKNTKLQVVSPSPKPLPTSFTKSPAQPPSARSVGASTISTPPKSEPVSGKTTAKSSRRGSQDQKTALLSAQDHEDDEEEEEEEEEDEDEEEEEEEEDEVDYGDEEEGKSDAAAAASSGSPGIGDKTVSGDLPKGDSSQEFGATAMTQSALLADMLLPTRDRKGASAGTSGKTSGKTSGRASGKESRGEPIPKLDSFGATDVPTDVGTRDDGDTFGGDVPVDTVKLNEANLEFIKKGLSLKKYFGMGSVHAKTFWITDDLSKLCWAEKKGKESKFILTKSIVDIDPAPSGVAKKSQSFAIKTLDRDPVVAEARSDSEKAKVVAAIKAVVFLQRGPDLLEESETLDSVPKAAREGIESLREGRHMIMVRSSKEKFRVYVWANPLLGTLFWSRGGEEDKKAGRANGVLAFSDIHSIVSTFDGASNPDVAFGIVLKDEKGFVNFEAELKAVKKTWLATFDHLIEVMDKKFEFK